jgi:glutathione S-transferase
LTEHFSQGKTLLPKRYHDGHEGQPGGETDEWMRYQYYLQYPEGSLMPPLLVGLILLSMSASAPLCRFHEAGVC